MNRTKFDKLFKGKRSFSKRVRLALAPALALCITLLFAGPLEITALNLNSLSYTPLDILPTVLLVTGISFALLLLAASIPGGKVHAYLISAYTGLGIAMFVQAAFLNPELGALDSHTINWKSFSTMMVINFAVWFIILSIPHLIHYFSNRAWRIFSVSVSLALILIQSFLLCEELTELKLSDRESSASLYLSAENLLSVGSENNIVVFLLNETSNHDILSMTEKYPEALAPFHDFTGYDNPNSHYMFTFPSLVNLLTGQEWDNENERIHDYMSRAWNSEEAASFYQKLADNGYERSFYFQLPFVSDDPAMLQGKFSNLKQADGKPIINREALRNLYKLSGYRCCPVMLKPFFMLSIADITGMISREDAWTDEWDLIGSLNAGNLSKGESRNAFTFYYLNGSNGPYELNESGQLPAKNSGAATSAETLGKDDQLAGFFYQINRYMDQLKELGLYEQTGIIILSDHGNNSDKAADHQPIYLVKMPNEQHDTMRRSSAQITIQESFLADVMEMTGEDGSQWGIPSAKMPEGAVERWTRTFAKDNSYPQAEDGAYNVLREFRYDRDGDYLSDLWIASTFTVFPIIESYY